MVDYGQMKRFGVSSSRLPEGAIILNEPAGLYSTHREAVWITVAAFGILASVILALLDNIRKRQDEERQRRDIEAQLLQSQKMEAVGTLAGGIAHDFNNILSIIFGNAELAKFDTQKEKRNRHIDQVLAAADRAKALVQQILAFGKKNTLEKQPTQLSSLVDDTARLLRSTLPTTIEIRREVTSGGIVDADPTQIQQIIMNLCTNAAHAMKDEKGVLGLRLKEVALSEQSVFPWDGHPGRYLLLEVSDTGCGMDKETRDKIFDPYFTTKPKGQGTGLGMAVVHGIVKSHGGHITVYSEPGHGTSVHVYLPLSPSQPVPVQTAFPLLEDLDGNNERILFVDDEAQLCESMSALLTRHGYQITTFSESVSAWTTFQQDPSLFDLVITDMTMPHLPGHELAMRIISLCPGLPVILCTGHSSLINREKALRIGIYEYLDKPVSTTMLLKTIKEAISNRAAG
jgi:signal transduction histidine kinase/CheY-like chemotaxis protein